MSRMLVSTLLPVAAALLCASGSLGASPAVEATLALPRTEPRHYVDAVIALSDLGATAEATAIAQEFAGLGMSDQQMIKLADAVGTAKLTKLGRVAPGSAATVEKVLATAHAAANSPERLAALVSRLSGERDQAVEAIRAMRNSGQAGVDYCLAQIAETNDPKLRARLREALVALDPISQPALFEAAGSSNAQVAEQAAYALGRLAELNRLRSPVSAALVAGRTLQPGPAGDAARWAYQQIAGRPPMLPAVRSELNTAIDELLKSPVLFSEATPVSPKFAVQLAARLAADLAEVDPGNGSSVRLALLLGLENDSEVRTESLATDQLATALHEALERGLYVAAQRCCQTLGERRDPLALNSGKGTPAPLAAALESGHSGVRFAAVKAILEIAPTQPFAGSSRVAETLLHLASATGDDVAVVAYPQMAKAGQTASWLLAAGYAATPANRGSDALRIASESPDVQLVLIDMSIRLPGARETLFRLRRSPTTALTPILLLAADGRLGEAQRLAAEHGGAAGRVLAGSRPHSVEVIGALAKDLTATAASGLPDGETRLAQADFAREAIAKIVAEGPAFYGMSAHAQQVVSLTIPTDELSFNTLAAIGTPESQLRLLDAASFETLSIDSRNLAAKAFGRSLREHGVLLTREQIRRQYDRYNLSASASAETQQVLGHLLDLIEGVAP